MRIEQLQSFVEIASSKSISIAAENLYITQPSLSRSMKLLEDELGLTLFIRSSDGVRLTDAGKALLPTVQNVLYQLDCLKQQANTLSAAASHSYQNTFTICAMEAIADAVLVSALEEMQHAFPSTEFLIHVPENLDPYILPDLSNYNLFIGVNIGDTFDHAIEASGLQMVSVFTDKCSIVVNRKHPLATRKIVAIDDLLDYKLILHNYDFSIENFYEKIIQPKKQNETLNVILRSNNSRVIYSLLHSSSEAILLTNNILAVNDYAQKDDLTIIPSKSFKYPCFCLFHPDDPQLMQIHRLIKILQDTRLKLSLDATL